MFVKLSSFFVNLLISCRTIDASEENIYTYGFELLLSSFAGIAILHLSSALLDVPFSWTLYLLGFVQYRITGGGYHATSHTRCLIIFSLAYLIAIAINNHVYKCMNYGAITSACMFVLFVFVAPVEAANKTVSLKRQRKLRIIGMGLALLSLFWGIIFASFCEPSKALSMYYTGSCTAGVSIVAGFISNKTRR